ncbi:MAG TPA: hypothetical protein VFV97_04000 [Rhodanobacteraceae bacterium]|nr:hypothetical protein [Rhodanobacteraceae bacterium]
MQETARWLGYALLGLLVLFVALIAAYRLRGPTRTQREALSMMQRDYAPKAGRNAFPLLWYMQYDVPDDAVDARLAGEIAALAQQLDSSDGAKMLKHEPDANKLAEASLDTKTRCGRGMDCLAGVRADPEAMRAKLASFPVMLGREKAFEETDYYRNPFPLDYRAFVYAVPHPAEGLWLASFALKYVDGDHAGALRDVCRNIGTWRRLHRNSDSLIGSMTAIANADSGMRLFADMTAALPQQEPVPSECAAALGPVEAADLDRCSEMTGEFGFAGSIQRFYRSDPERPWWERAADWLVFEPHQSEAWRAEQNARYCGAAALARMQRDVPSQAGSWTPVTHRVECVASFLGCIEADVVADAYRNYDERTLDFAAHLRLAATVLWLRENGRRFDDRPLELRSGARDSAINVREGWIYVANLFGGNRFELAVKSLAH